MDMATTTTSCTETPTAMPEETEMPPSTITVPYGDDSSAEDEEPCEESMDSSEHQSMHETAMPEYETTTTVVLPAATRTANTEVAHYTAMDDMVNAANSWYKAWNPYKPAYTPSTGN